MFAVVAAFCYIFMRRARAKGHREALRRARIYVGCAAGMIASFLLFAIHEISGDVVAGEPNGAGHHPA